MTFTYIVIKEGEIWNYCNAEIIPSVSLSLIETPTHQMDVLSFYTLADFYWLYKYKQAERTSLATLTFLLST